MEFSKEAVGILEHLLPGFMMAWVFYSFTPHRKPPQFERVIQALIFNLIIYAVKEAGDVIFWRGIHGKYWDSLAYFQTPDTIKVTAIALSLGFVFAAFANNDVLHRVCRFLKISKEASYPSEWCGNFSKHVTHVVLNLKDGRRLYGWPAEWPSDPDKGHFAIQEASWLVRTENGTSQQEIDLPMVERVLIKGADVEFVEFMKPSESEKKEKSHDEPSKSGVTALAAFKRRRKQGA